MLFFEDDVLVFPAYGIGAESIANFSCVTLVVKNFKEEIIAVGGLDHEWISDKAGGDVGDIFCCEYGVADSFVWVKRYRGWALIHADCPGFFASALDSFFAMLVIACKKCQRCRNQYRY